MKNSEYFGEEGAKTKYKLREFFFLKPLLLVTNVYCCYATMNTNRLTGRRMIGSIYFSEVKQIVSNVTMQQVQPEVLSREENQNVIFSIGTSHIYCCHVYNIPFADCNQSSIRWYSDDVILLCFSPTHGKWFQTNQPERELGDRAGDTVTSLCVFNEKDMALQWQI